MVDLITLQANQHQELQSEVAHQLAQLAIVGSVVIGWALLPQTSYPFEILPLLAVLAGVNGLGLFYLQHSKVKGALLFISSVNSLTLLVAMAVFPQTWLPFIALPVMLVDALLVSNLAGLAFTLVVFGAAVGLNLMGMRQYDLDGLLLVLGTGLAVNWLSINSLSTAADWYRMAQSQSEHLLDETRQHRAELSRANKSLMIANDLQRKTQNELIFARKQADRARQMKEQFAANISHELRTPLNLILGFSKIMYLSPEVYGKINWTPELQHDISQIFRSSRHLTEMIDDILDLSQFEMSGFSLVREPTALYLYLKDAADTIGNLFRSGPVHFKTNIQEDLPTLDIDRTRIRQVLVNLLTNAYRYAQSGSVELNAEVKGEEVFISVCDSGPGIPPEKLPFIFDEFYQADSSLSRKAGGVGLGLTISRRLVEAHNGRIWVESQPGNGSKFIFALPCSGATVPFHAEGNSETPYSGLLPNMLFVGSDPEMISIIRRQVEMYEWIPVQSLVDLAPAVNEFRPRGVLINLPPEQITDIVNLPDLEVPVIACSLPSRLHREGTINKLTLLRKPVELDELTQELERNGNVHDLFVIDDDRGFVQLMDRLVRATGKEVSVRWAYNGQEGLLAMREKQPDLVLLDLVMQDLSGMQVLELIQSDELLRNIPICIVTSGSYELEALSQAGRMIIIQQSGGFRPSKLFDYLRTVLKQIEPNHTIPAEEP